MMNKGYLNIFRTFIRTFPKDIVLLEINIIIINQIYLLISIYLLSN